ncbi:MAG: DsrE family protein [Phycisphaerae bacterium]
MSKICIVLLADIDTPEAMGRMANALATVMEFDESGDEVALVFDGAGTRWVGVLSNPDHKYHGAFEGVRHRVAAVCAYCANAFGVADQIRTAELPLTSEFRGHPSIRQFVNDGYQVISF